ncbi:Alpha/Beta hydrolase protein [Lasiosphaeria miniovina]|uniref:Dipeptidyl-peptidase V n=1 Tax=Lasiosphaeria miniovina TaxID=1954250 RepID=A0AA40EB13_9PEZI|nr:Alpha/Beta hydrolase protein [Lasiosphaeria miniovina]KAK0734989.1 Alpha/Beta hydrolase protein [Lasiosphaeria miniovina]
MTFMAAKFTPEVLLSAPRRSAALPNPSGTRALYTVSSYSFESHSKTSQISVLDITSGQSQLLLEQERISEPTWLSDDDFLYLRGNDEGTTSLLVTRASSHSTGGYILASIDAAVSNIKVKKLANGSFALAFTALASPEGRLVNPGEKKPYSTAKVYSSLFVRHWDTWLTENRSSVWYSALEKRGNKYSLAAKGFVNALAGQDLECPVPPFGGSGDFDIGPAGLVFVSKDPKLCPATYTKTDLYFVPLTTFTESSPPSPKIVTTPGLEGYTNSPTFSHCGQKVAFTRMRNKQYESDKPRLLLLPDISDLGKVEEFYATDDGEGGWDIRPEGAIWSADDASLFVTAEQTARTLIFSLPAKPADAKDLPSVLKSPDGSVGAVRQLADGSSKLLVTSSSLVDNSCFSVVDPSHGTATIISSISKQGKTFGLSRSSCGDITFKGAGDYDVHALVMRPSSFNHSKKYPLAFLIHGGPQGAWGDSWSTRWNPAIFAEQGYVVVCPNPTGSTGYGMALENGIKGQWGGRPYDDLVKCFEYIAENMPYVDIDRAVALGASYGGYMINWIQGHPLGRKFKALVCHDGVYSTLNQWSSEELFFPIHDFEGTIYDNRAGYEKWDPARFVNEWATPQLIIHNELDYRLPITEGLSPFNILQSKGIPSKLLMFPDENHWVLKPENSFVWHREVLGWINKYAGIDQDQDQLAVVESMTKATSI